MFIELFYFINASFNSFLFLSTTYCNSSFCFWRSERTFFLSLTALISSVVSESVIPAILLIFLQVLQNETTSRYNKSLRVDCSHCTESMQLVIFWIGGVGPTAVAGHRLHCNWSSSEYWWGGFNCSLPFNCANNYITAVLIKCICICIPSQDKPFFRDSPWWLSWRPPVLFHKYWAMLPSLTYMGIWNKYSNNG